MNIQLLKVEIIIVRMFDIHLKLLYYKNIKHFDKKLKIVLKKNNKTIAKTILLINFKDNKKKYHCIILFLTTIQNNAKKQLLTSRLEKKRQK